VAGLGWYPCGRLQLDIEYYIELYIKSVVNKISMVFNRLEPTGYVMHEQVKRSRIVLSAPTVFMCFVFISEQTATSSPIQHN